MAQDLVDPIDRIEWRDADSLRANHWNPNRVFKPEMRLLERSLLTTGWIQPLLINDAGLIIDGFHRWRLSTDSKAVRERWGGKVPCAVLPIGDDEAMAVTVRINRAKGAHIAVEMSRLVASLLEEHQWTRERIAQEIGATLQEVDLLAQEGVFAAKGIDKWKYSPAWYPVEADEKPPVPEGVG